ncbi:hypothetical protein AB6E95_07555 [Vibrio splendidus]|uniref:hypothetical protein n=1 Tax=Vibrio splendidus TaxID=29497 RepID=UPI000C83D569|nr:hypothetical protein [Vibrio splendidus]PMM08986.1 hypothetical protein BCT62_14230 [Vibrio splendidus]
MSSDFLKTDTIAICAVIISILSLFSTIWQLRSSKKHSILSVRPSLNLNWDLTENNKISCSLLNGGIGPAYLSKLYFNVLGRKVQIKSYKDFIDFFNEYVNSDFKLDYRKKFGVIYGGFDKEAVISQGSSLLLMEFHNDNQLDRNAILKYIKDLEIEVGYKCAYEQCYLCRSTSIKILLDLP